MLTDQCRTASLDRYYSWSIVHGKFHRWLGIHRLLYISSCQWATLDPLYVCALHDRSLFTCRILLLLHRLLLLAISCLWCSRGSLRRTVLIWRCRLLLIDDLNLLLLVFCGLLFMDLLVLHSEFTRVRHAAIDTRAGGCRAPELLLRINGEAHRLLAFT